MKNKLFDSFWIRSVFFTMLNRSFPILFGVVGYMLLTKKVFPTAALMGDWSLFLVITSLFETIKQGLLRNPMIKFLSEPEYRDQKNKVQTVALMINIVFTALVMSFFIFMGKEFTQWIHSKELYPVIMWGLLVMLLLVPFNHFEVLLQANFKFHNIAMGYLLRQGVFVTSIIFFVLFFRSYLGLVTLVKLQALSISMGLVALYIGAKGYLFKGWVFDKKLLVKMLHYGKYIFGTNVFSALSGSADQFVTFPLIGPVAVAYYNIVSRLTNMIDIPSQAVADVLFPKNVEAMALEGTSKVRYYFERMVANIITILLPVSLFMVVFPGLIIRVISTSKYLDAIPILQLIIIFSFLRPFSYQFGATMDAIGKPQYNFWVNLYAMSVNFLLIFFGLKHFGYMGAAYGEVLAVPLVYGVIFLVLKKTIQVNFSNIAINVWNSYRDIFRMIKQFLSKKKYEPGS